MTIPKVIHQVWVGDKQRPDNWMKTWKDHHPDWEYVLWDNERVKEYPFVNKAHIEKLMDEKKFHGVADVVRYEAVHDFGGVAMPADSECVHPIDELMDLGRGYDCFTCYENEHAFPGRLTPVIGARKGNKLMKLLIEGLQKKQSINEPWIDSGNVFLTQTVADNQYTKVKIFPSYYFMPNHRCGGNYDGTSKYYSLQYSGTTFNLYE